MAEGQQTIRPLPIDSSFNQPQARYAEPVEIGSYSTTHDRTFTHDRSQLRYYVGPTGVDSTHPDPVYEGPVELDLTKGFEDGILQDRKNGLDAILKWILINPNSIDNVDIICRRGVLESVMMTPFQWINTWKIAAVGFRGKIYMCKMTTEEELAEIAKQTDESMAKSKEMTFLGFKFEQYVTSDRPDGVPKTDEPVNCNEAFFSVVTSSLNKHRLLFSGEVDCIENKNDKPCYIELKTCKEPTTDKEKYNFKRYKLSTTWAQSLLPGVKRVVYGFKDNSGVVKRLKTFQTSSIPEYCADVKGWTPAVALNFCDKFLQHVRKTVTDDSNSIVYVFDRRPKAASIVGHIEGKLESEYTVLPSWYTDEI